MTENQEFVLIVLQGVAIGFIVFGIGLLIVIFVGKIIEWYEKTPLIKCHIDWNGTPRYYIYRRRYGGQIYEVPRHDWWMHPSTLGTYFSTKEDALANLPPGPLGFIGKWKKKKEQQKILREREQRLKEHKDRMLKTRLDFSDYG